MYHIISDISISQSILCMCTHVCAHSVGVYVCACRCICVRVYTGVYVPVCGSQRPTSGVSLQVPSTLF